MPPKNNEFMFTTKDDMWSPCLRGEWFAFPIDIWNFIVYVFVGTATEMRYSLSQPPMTESQRKSAALYLDKKIQTPSEMHRGDTFYMERCGCIRIDDFRIGNIEDILALSHQSLHLANAIVQIVGALDDCAETLAFTHESILRKSLHALVDKWEEKMDRTASPDTKDFAIAP